MAQADNKAFQGCGTLFGWVIFLAIAWFVITWLLPNEWRIKYVLMYSTSYKNVTVQPRPTNCDFFHAPIGDKACHYEKEVSTVNWAMSNVGNPIVSYDERKTWAAGEPPPNAKLPITYVYVAWNKLEDP